LDNTFYKTEMIRSLGVFPVLQSNSGIDTLLAYLIYKHGFEWKVNPDCVSVHIRKGLRQELRHQRWYAIASVEARNNVKKLNVDGSYLSTFLNFRHGFQRLLLSPVAGVFVSLKMRNPLIAVVHPLIKLFWFVGYLDSRKA